MKKILTTLLLIFFVIGTVHSQYCTSSLYYGGCGNDYIRSFSTTGGVTNIINLQSGCSGSSAYNYYSNHTHTTIVGATVNFKIVNNPQNGENYKIWVDYDNDNTFSSTEEVYSGNIPFGDSVTASFAIPSGTALGVKRMRIRGNRYSSTFTACSQESYGGNRRL